MESPNPGPKKPLENRSLPWWTWVLPVLLFHLGTGLSLNFQVAPGMSLWYFPVPLGLLLIQWWGPRVLIGLFLNSMLCAGYWGLDRWWLWPLYAVPETLKVALSWWLFTHIMKGKPWLPDLPNTTRFLIFGLCVPSLIGSLAGQLQFGLLGDAPMDGILQRTYAEFVLDVLSPFAITVPALLFCTSVMERLGLSMTRGAHPRPPLIATDRFGRAGLYETAAVFAALLFLNLGLSLERFWFVHGFFMMWAAIRFGIGVASLATVWTIFLAVPFPALLSRHSVSTWYSQSDLLTMNLNLATLCFAALVVGRALSDLIQEVAERARADGKYRTLFASASDAIVLGRDGVFLDCNGKALEMFGAGRDQFVGAPTSRFFPAELEDGGDAVAELARIRAKAMSGTPQEFEWRMRRQNGTLFHSEVTMAAVDLGEKPMTMAVIRDITRRKQMERELSENEIKYRTLFESATDTIFLAEAGKGILDANAAALTMFRCSREHFIGMPATVISPERQSNGTASADGIAAFRTAALEGRPQRFEWTFRRADGSLFDAETSLTAVDFGGVRRLLVVIRDVSARKAIGKALLESEERFRQMAENIQEVFFLLECETRKVLYLSALAKTMLGAPLAEITGNPFSLGDRVHPEDRARTGFFAPGAWSTRPFNSDFRYLHPDGGTRWLRLRSFLIPGQDGSIYRVAGVIADITEYKVAQEQAKENQQRLIQADKMNSLGLMVSGVAHEINNPNNLIMLNADVLDTFWKHMRPVLREHASGNPEWKPAGLPYAVAEGNIERLLSGVSGGSKRIKRIVDNLKDFARVDSGDLSESVALDKVVEASVGIIDNLIRKATDRFIIIQGEDMPRVLGNFQKLEQVVINLITNACQALENRTQSVRVTTWHESGTGVAGIRVEDEGRGIPAGLLDKVTDPFFTTKRDTGGTGLGLSVTYGIVSEHRGRIEIRSEERRGTTVEIRIPVLSAKT